MGACASAPEEDGTHQHHQGQTFSPQPRHTDLHPSLAGQTHANSTQTATPPTPSSSPQPLQVPKAEPAQADAAAQTQTLCTLQSSSQTESTPATQQRSCTSQTEQMQPSIPQQPATQIEQNVAHMQAPPVNLILASNSATLACTQTTPLELISTETQVTPRTSCTDSASIESGSHSDPDLPERVTSFSQILPQVQDPLPFKSLREAYAQQKQQAELQAELRRQLAQQRQDYEALAEEHAALQEIKYLAHEDQQKGEGQQQQLQQDEQQQRHQHHHEHQHLHQQQQQQHHQRGAMTPGNLSILQQEHVDLQHKHANLQQEHLDLQHKHASLRQEHFDLQHKHASLRQERLDLQHKHASLRQEHVDLQHKHANLQQQHGSLRAAHTQLVQSLGDLGSLLHSLGLLDPSRAEQQQPGEEGAEAVCVEQLIAGCKAQHRKSAQYGAQLRELMSEVERLKIENASVQQSYETVFDAEQAARVQVLQLKLELEEAHAASELPAASIQQPLHDRQRFKTMAEDSEAAAQVLKQQLHKSEQAAADARQEAKKLAAELHSNQVLNEFTAGQTDTLLRDFASLKERHLALLQEMDANHNMLELLAHQFEKVDDPGVLPVPTRSTVQSRSAQSTRSKHPNNSHVRVADRDGHG